MRTAHSHLIALLPFCSLLAAPTLPLGAADWPQWRGPNRDGLSTETGLLKSWPEGGPPLHWKIEGLGRGFSSVSVANGQIFTSGDAGPASQVHAFDLSGNKLWSSRLGRTGERGGYHGPRGTPSVADGLVFALGQFGDLACYDAKTGAEQWRKNLDRDLDGDVGGWGYSESPLLDANRVICAPGGRDGTVAAFDQKTGRLLWRTKDLTDRAEYSSIIAATIDGVRQYIILTDRNVAGIAVEDGRVLWKASRRGSTAVIPTPIHRDGFVYVTSGYGVGCNLFKVQGGSGGFRAEEVYDNNVMVNHHGGVILLNDHVYGYSDGKGWTCQNFATGEMVWSEKKLGKGCLAYADERFYLRSESDGTLVLIEATPSAYRETGRFKQPDRSDQNAWPHPVIVGGKLYVRDQDILLCYNVQAGR